MTSCYVESGYDISKQLEKKVTYLDGKYVINCLGISINEGEPSIDLFQKRGSDEFKSFRFSFIKNYQPKEKNINIEIKNTVYKLKNEENLLLFSGFEEYNYPLYFNSENNNLQRHYLSDEDKKLGLIGSYKFYLNFPQPVKARQLEYIEFDLSITDEEGNVYNHHLHYDVSIKPVFKIGSTLWEYWSGI